MNLSADETVSREKGKWVEAAGHVHMRYEMEAGDLLESFSQFAQYNEKEGLGILWGDPRAFWHRADPAQPVTRLTADKITLRIHEAEVLAQGRVRIAQSSSTLRAETVTFSNRDKRLTATDGAPEFEITQPQHHTRIRARRIIAWAEKKEVQFSGRVEGQVRLQGAVPPVPEPALRP